MSIREAALKSEAFRALKEAYDDKQKAVKKWKACGKKAVFMLGDDIPEELIIAAGLLPVRLTGWYGGERVNADKYLERSFGPIWRGVFEAVVNGSLKDEMDFLVLQNSSDMILKIFYYLREMKRAYKEISLPPLKFVDLIITDKIMRAQEQDLDEFKDLCATLEDWSGNKITDEAIREAGVQCNAFRAAIRDFSALRYGAESRVTGSEAITAITGAMYMDKAEGTELLKKLAADAASWPVVDALSIYYTGSLNETSDVYELVEAAGGNIVSEDKFLGDRYAARDMRMDITPFRALVDMVLYRFPSSERGTVKERAEVVPARMQEVGAKALLVYMHFNDESYIWDFPKQKIKLDELGLASIVVEKQNIPIVEPEALKVRLADFFKSVKGGK